MRTLNLSDFKTSTHLSIIVFVRTKNFDLLAGILLAITGCEAMFAKYVLVSETIEPITHISDQPRTIQRGLHSSMFTFSHQFLLEYNPSPRRFLSVRSCIQALFSPT